MIESPSAASAGRAWETRIRSMYFIDPLYSISGFGVGFLVGMTGVGGDEWNAPSSMLTAYTKRAPH